MVLVQVRLTALRGMHWCKLILACTYDLNGDCEGRNAMLGVLEFGVGVHDFVHDLLVLELVARRAESGPTPCCVRGHQHEKIARDAHERPSTRQRASRRRTRACFYVSLLLHGSPVAAYLEGFAESQGVDALLPGSAPRDGERRASGNGPRRRIFLEVNALATQLHAREGHAIGSHNLLGVVGCAGARVL